MAGECPEVGRASCPPSPQSGERPLFPASPERGQEARATAVPSLAPHDLVRPVDAALLDYDGEPPAWVADSLARSPLVVVRRASCSEGRWPVGIRGWTRGERSAAWLPPSAVGAVIRPEDLVAERAWLTAPRALQYSHFGVLEAVRVMMEDFAATWGPTGAMGYELASGMPCLTAVSDVDLLMRASEPPDRQALAELACQFARLPVWIDVQMETPQGAVALAEYVSGRSQMVLRTRLGPRLVRDPWAAAEEGA